MKKMCWLFVDNSLEQLKKHFPIEHGRWIQRENRKYHLCNLEIGDQFHIISGKKNNDRYQNLHLEKSGATSGAGTAYPSGAPEFIPGFEWGSCYSIFSCYVYAL